MASRALKTALMASLLTRSDADWGISRRRTATSEHNERAEELKKV